MASSVEGRLWLEMVYNGDNFMLTPSRTELSSILSPLAGYSAAELEDMLRDAHQALRDRGQLLEHQGLVESFERWRDGLLKLASLTICRDGSPIPEVETALDLAQALHAAAFASDLAGRAGSDIACIIAEYIVKTGLRQFCSTYRG